MPIENKVIPYKVQKGNRPKIEEVISCCLDGDLRETALNFAMYMRENKMPFKLNTSSTRSQRADYNGERICQIIVYDEEDWKNVWKNIRFDNVSGKHWSISLCLTNINKYKEKIINEKLQLVFGDIIYWCKYGGQGSGKGPCDPDKSCAGGRDLTIFGDGYNGICMWLWPPVQDPDDKTIKTIKRLLELEKQARDENINEK